MARARNIKPALFKNEILGVEDPLLTLLFINLWCLADKDGKLEDRPLRIKAETFPYRENIDINGYLTKLVQHGFIRRYSVDGVAVIQVIKFKQHQSPHSTEKESSLPDFDPNYTDNTQQKDLTVRSPLDFSESTEAKRPDSLIPDSLNTDSLKKEKIIKKEIDPELKKLLHDVDDQVITDFSILRKQKKAPITESAVNGLRREAAQAGIDLQTALITCCQNGWQGFKAEWYKKSQAPPANLSRHQLAHIAARSFFGNSNEEKIVNGEVIEHETIARKLG